MEEMVMLELLEENDEAGAVGAVGERYPRADALTSLSEAKFRFCFRIPKDLFTIVVEILTPLMRPPIRAPDLDIPVRILAALRFFASGSYQMDVGSNLFIAMSQPSVSRCISEVSECLNNPEVFHRFVAFPRNFDELNAVRLQFSEKYDFPGVVGCLDCTHVAIVAPPADDPIRPGHLYINRKGYHSLNVQLICDTNLKILNVNASHPGSTHDSFIWNTSNVQQIMRDIHAAGQGTYFLLGDSGYPLRPWLLTPFENEPAPNTPDHRYNCAQKRVRSIIERCNGVLKNRFRCLLKHRVLHYSPQKAGQIINACTVLHNICIEYNIANFYDENEVEDNEGIFHVDEQQVAIGAANPVDPELAEGRRVRQELIALRFTNRN